MSHSIFETKWFRYSFYLTILIFVAISSQEFPKLVNKANFRIQDFAYYFELTKYWWHTPGNIYDLNYQIKVYSDLFGVTIDRPMPVMWSQLTLLVFLPLVPLSYIKIELAHLVWIIFSVVVALLATYLKSAQSKSISLINLLFLTHISLYSAMFGQISIVACGIYCLIIGGFAKGKTIWQVLALMILSIKPTFLLPAGMVLLARKQFRTLFIAAIAIISWILFCEYRSGYGVLFSYLQVLSMFSSEVIKAPYNLSYDPSINVNWLMFVKPYLGWEISYLSSIVLFAICQVLAVYIAICMKNNSRSILSFLVSMSGYLLFSPYIGWYEELLLISVVFAVYCCGDNKKSIHLIDFVIVLLLILILSRPIEPSRLLMQIFFMARLLVLMLLAYRFKPSSKIIVGSNSCNQAIS